MVITQNKQKVVIDVDLGGTFTSNPGISTAAGGLEIGNTNVTRGDFNDPEMSGIKPTDPSETDGEALGSTNVNKYVEVCKCNRAKSFTCNTETLFTITKSELFVCIRSKSPDVKVDFLEKMVSDFAGSGSACCFFHVPGIVSLTYQFLLGCLHPSRGSYSGRLTQLARWGGLSSRDSNQKNQLTKPGARN